MLDTQTDTDDRPEDTGWSSGTFYGGPPFDLDETWGCDPLGQNCPEGEKCVPYSSTGTTWDANKCVPILGDGQPGDACHSDGVIVATDTCDGTSVCWHVEMIAGELLGSCVPFCAGLPGQPECAPGSSCVIANNGWVNVCLQDCDPLMQDCPEGLGCHWLAGQFVCVLTDEGLPNRTCDDGECPAGSTCVHAELVPGCAGSACCTLFCSLNEPGCVEPTSECVPFFDEPVEGYEDLGICVGR